MSVWHQVEVAGEIGRAYACVLAGGIALALVLAATAAPEARSRLRVAVLLLLASLLGTLACAGLLRYDPGEVSTLRVQLLLFLAQILYAIGAIQIAGTLLVRVLLPRIGLCAPTWSVRLGARGRAAVPRGRGRALPSRRRLSCPRASAGLRNSQSLRCHALRLPRRPCTALSRGRLFAFSNTPDYMAQ